MSRRGDDEGFRPHPGDPWHPGWSSGASAEPEPEPEAVEAAPADLPAAGPGAGPAAPPRRRRLGGGRRRGRLEEAAEGEPSEPGEAPVPEVSPSPGPGGDLAGWWVAGKAVDESAWEEQAAADAPAVGEEEEQEEQEEGTPAAPTFPWWTPAAAPAEPLGESGPLPGEPPASEPGAEPEPPAREKTASAASWVPLDLPTHPAAPPPLPAAAAASAAVGWKAGAQPAAPEVPAADRMAEPPTPPPRLPGQPEVPRLWEPMEGDTGAPGVLVEPGAEADAGTVADDLERATAALLAHIGEEPAVEEGEVTAEVVVTDGPGAPPWGPPASEAPLLREAGEVAAPGLDEGLGLESAGLVLSVWEPPEGSAPAGAGAPAAGPGAGEEAVPAMDVDAEVDEWLAFVEGVPAGAAPAARAPQSVAPPLPEALEEGGVEAEEARPAEMAPRRRGWLGRRGRSGALPEQAPARAGAPAQEAAPLPPPWPAAAGEAGVAEGTEEAVDEASEAEAAWHAWVAGSSEAGLGDEEAPPAAQAPEAPAEPEPSALWTEPPVLPPRPVRERTARFGGEAEPSWEGAEWAGEPAPEPAGWYAAVDEDEAAVPPAALPEEEWEEEGWESFPQPGAPLPEPAGEAGAAPAAGPGGVAEVGFETEGWETFPEPGGRLPRPPGGEEPGGPTGPEPASAVGRPEPSPAGGSTERTMETPPVFDFEVRALRQGPISEEILAGAVTMEHRGLAEEVAAADTAETELQALSAPMPGLESGVVGFEDVAHLGEDEEVAAPAGRSDLPVRVATGMVLVGLLLGSLWVGGEFLAGFVGLLVILGLGEFYAALRVSGYQPLALFGFLGGIGILVGTWFFGLVAIPTAVVATTVLSFFYYAFSPRRRDALTNGGLTLLGMTWVTGTAAFAFPIAAAPHFRDLVLALAATVVATDVGAYFAGRAWGARPMAPVLSPHKTWEGLAGGVVLGIGAAVAVGFFRGDAVGIRAGAALGLVVAVMAPLGDLAESMLKRSLGVKDMGSILPGHGGILDRVDAFLFVLPAAWVLYETMGLLR